MDRMKPRAAREILLTPRRPLAPAMVIALLFWAGAPLPALAKNCDTKGHLRFVGTTADSARSVWLSATSAGAFRLDSAQGNQTVDSWSKSRRGLHLSLSPNVSNGNGGTHKLYDNGSSGDCLLDTQNQIGGFVLPPTFIPPTIARPPIGTLPPSGLMPTLPGGVTPPIGHTTTQRADADAARWGDPTHWHATTQRADANAARWRHATHWHAATQRADANAARWASRHPLARCHPAG